MPKKRKAEANGLDEMDRELYGTFRTAANRGPMGYGLRRQAVVRARYLSRSEEETVCGLHSATS